MEVELIEIRQFLAARNPFSYLSDEILDKLPEDMEIRYLRRGSEFPPRENSMYMVRSGAIEIVDEDGELCEKLGEGDLYSVGCQLIDFGSCKGGHAAEDTLLYMLPCQRLKALCKESEVFSQHFSASVKERLKRAVSTMQEANTSGDISYMMVEVGSLVRRRPISTAMTNSIRETAMMMSEENVSSVMVMDDARLVGVVTDRDLRKRCVAAGLSGDEPITAIMTADPQTISPATLTAQALMTMTRMHVHHLPVVEAGQVIGMITATDLAQQQSANSAYLATDVRKAKTVDDLTKISQRLPNLHLRLANASVTAKHIGEAVSCITDSITARLLEMAEAQLGPAPVPYVWLAGGSQARHEQSSHSDQDNALLIADDMLPEHDAYFAALAKFVSDGLNACGFVYCPGNAMATNPHWRQPLRVWQKYFRKWIESPDPKSLMFACIFFDLRAVTGEVALFNELQKEILKRSQTNRIFLGYMVANAMQYRPPLGFFRQFVLIRGGEHDDTLDLKHRGIVPITDMARVMVLAQGLPQVNTTERLRAASQTPVVSNEMAENLEDALEFIASLRIRHQAEQISKHRPTDNYLPPEDLSELERDHLKDAFRVIKTMQEAMVHRFQADRLV